MGLGNCFKGRQFTAEVILFLGRAMVPDVSRHYRDLELMPGIGMDIDNPVDLVTFLRMSPSVRTRTLTFLEQSGVAGRLLATS